MFLVIIIIFFDKIRKKIFIVMNLNFATFYTPA